MWRRRALTGLLVSLSLLPQGCSSSDGVQVATGNPPGRLIAGRGPVPNLNAAVALVLADYLGVGATRQDGPVIGGDDDPLLDLYRLDDTATPQGTVIRPFFDETGYRLNQDYFVFFVDLNPAADFEHPAFYLYVRPDDGAIFEQQVASFPVVDDLIRLTSDADQAAHLVYGHALFQPPAATRQSPPTLSGGSAHGLFLGGSDEGRRQADFDHANDYLKEVTGEAEPLDRLWHNHPNPIDKADVATALRDASSGLGADDKFFLIISTHGKELRSEFQVGTERMTYEELCRAIEENVTAGHVNILTAVCFSGKLHDIFLGWDDDTTKGVRWYTGAPSDKESYSDEDQGNWALACAFEKLTEALAAARGDGSLTVAELEVAMAGLRVTEAELLDKIIANARAVGGADNPAVQRFIDDIQSDDGAFDAFPRPGTPRVGGFDAEAGDDDGGGGGGGDDGGGGGGGTGDVPQEARTLDYSLGVGSGSMGVQSVGINSTRLDLMTGPAGIGSGPITAQVRIEFEQVGAAGTGSMDFTGTVAAFGAATDGSYVVLDQGGRFPVVASPGAGDDVWSFWNANVSDPDFFVPGRPPGDLGAGETPIVLFNDSAGLALSILAPGGTAIASGSLLDALGSLVLALEGTVTPPSGPAFDTVGTLVIAIRAEGQQNIRSRLTFDTSAQAFPQSAIFLLEVLPAPQAGLAADANDDGDVDPGDYQVWQDNFGRTGATRTEGDFSGDGNVNAADYVVWRGQQTGTNAR